MTLTALHDASSNHAPQWLAIEDIHPTLANMELFNSSIEPLIKQLVDISQITAAICTVLLTILALIGLRELRQRLVDSHIELVNNTRSEWLAIANIMIDHPKLVITYANKHARSILIEKNEDEIREYAFANRVFELVSYYYQLRRSKALSSTLRELYPEGVEISAERLYEIWDSWGLKEDYSPEIQRFVINEVFKKHLHTLKASHASK